VGEGVEGGGGGFRVGVLHRSAVLDDEIRLGVEDWGCFTCIQVLLGAV
jgi:hypothetical protein